MPVLTYGMLVTIALWSWVGSFTHEWIMLCWLIYIRNLACCCKD